ncbi:hypothetical protein NL108_018612, partial [Boleophthalmus pectinirostris]
NNQMIVGGLGRPFTLGMLYNAPKDQLIPGMALWDSQTLQSLTVKKPQRSSHFDVRSSDSTADTSFNLNVNASVKLSFLSGLIEVGGSANYLNNKKQFKNQSRVTLQYQATTRFEQLSLTADVCEKIQNSVSHEKGLGTHVVTGIEYGANAFFVFDSQKVESSDLQTVKGQLEVTVKKIPTCDIHGEAKVELTEEEKDLVKTLSVQFYGDFLLESNPATFDAAVQTYVTLPKLLMGADGKEPVNTVPVKVWLLPLEVFKYEPVPVTKGISGGLVLEAEETLKDLENITMKCNECLSVSAVGKFPEFQHQVHKFSKLCRYYSVELQGQMAETCPAIREGTVHESVLRSLFDQRLMSPFSQDRLTKWLEDKEMEISMVQFFLDIMEGFPVLPTQAEVYKFVLAPGEEERWVYAFTSLGNADPQLEEMGQYLKALKSGKTYEPPQLQPEHPWFKKDEVVVKMWKEAVYFQQHKDRVHLCVTARSDTSHTGNATKGYKDGVLID